MLENVQRVYFNVPYDDKELARELGASWDEDSSKWYAKTKEIENAMLENQWKIVNYVELKKKRKRLGYELDEKKFDFFNIPRCESLVAEKLGAEWDFNLKVYKAPNDRVWGELNSHWPQCKLEDVNQFEYIELVNVKKRKNPSETKFESFAFNIPFKEKDCAKLTIGAKWDMTTKKWCATSKRMWDEMNQYWEQYVVPKEEEEPEVELPLFTEF